MQTNESEEAENPFELLPDFVLAMIMYMLTTSDLLKAMVLTCFHYPLPLLLFKDCLQKVVVHHSTRICCVGKQVCLYSYATRKIPENALFIFEKELFCATFESNR